MALTPQQIAATLEEWDREWWHGDTSSREQVAAGMLLDAIEEQELAAPGEIADARRFLAGRQGVSDRYNPWWHLRWAAALVARVPERVLP